MKTVIATSDRTTGWYKTLLLIIFFLVATSWLVGPFIHSEHYGQLLLISNYEGHGQPWAWFFRASDITASILIVVLAYYFKINKISTSVFYLLILYAIFSALDPIFPLDCQPQIISHCVSFQGPSTIVHYAESAITPLIAAILIGLDIYRRRNRISIAFLGLQVIFGLAFLAGLLPAQLAVLLEYIYEVVLILWLIYLFQGFLPPPKLPARVAKMYRTILAIWVGLAGALAFLVAAAHLHLYGHSFALYFGQSSTWLAEQGVSVGVLLLYLSRQIWRGQRRAAYALLLIFGFELFNYSLVSPHWAVAMVCGISLIIVFITRASFDHNVGRTDLHRRIYDLASVLGGVIISVLVVVLILGSLGRLHHAVKIADTGTDYVAKIFAKPADHFHHNDQLVETGDVLAFTIIAVSLWAVFRPSDYVRDTNIADRNRAKQLLESSSNSSEDYFKLWPHDKTYFFEGDGFVAYKVTRGTAFALADPIATTHANQQPLLTAFINYCKSKGWSVCFLLIDESNTAIYRDLNLLSIGSSAVVDLATFCDTTSHNKWWRWCINRATKADLDYRFSSPPHTDKLLNRLQNVSDMWLTNGGHREQGFALGYFDKAYLRECRIHYLIDSDKNILAFTNELPIFTGQKATIDLMRYLPGHDNPMPFLIASMIKQLAHEGIYTKLDLGFVPLAKLDNLPAQTIKTLGKIRFSASGLEQFKNKFEPDWQTNYLAYSGDLIDLASLVIKLDTALKPLLKK